MMRVLFVAVALATFITPASAQTSQSFFGRDGKFQGSAVTRGNSTSFYNRSGQFDGSAIRNGNSTTFYGKDGRYQGQVFTQPQSGSNPFGRKSEMMMKPKTDDANEITLYKARRKEISARYYQRNREVIKLCMTLAIPMKQARKIAQESGEAWTRS